MKLIEPVDGPPIEAIDVPGELYWITRSPVPLAGMKIPRYDFPWATLRAAGFSRVVALHPGSYDPAPLTSAFAEKLQDLVAGGPPADETAEREKIRRAVDAVLAARRSGHGIVVHCAGGCGRSGTVIGCVLRELGFPAADVIGFLGRVQKARSHPGWPESPWQAALVEGWS